MKKRGLLLDRDGVINVDDGYVGHRDQFRFIDGIFPFLRWVQDSGFRLAVITNQSGVARGYYTRADFDALTAWMRQECAREGITFDVVLACFEHSRGKVTEYDRDSFWRKPNPGMVLEAVQRMDLDPSRSAFIGDKTGDMQAAAGGGIATRLLLAPEPEILPQGAQRISNYDDARRILAATLF